MIVYSLWPNAEAAVLKERGVAKVIQDRHDTAKVVSILGQNGKQNPGQDARIRVNPVSGEVPELADGHDLGSCAFGRGSSSLPFPTRPKFA